MRNKWSRQAEEGALLDRQTDQEDEYVKFAQYSFNSKKNNISLNIC